MLAKKFRLPIQRWFKERKKAAVRQNDFLIVKFRPNSLSFNRFGVLIGGKTAKKAIERHKIKRIIFNFIRCRKFPKFSNQDFLIMVLSPTVKLKKIEIEKELKNILNF